MSPIEVFTAIDLEMNQPSKSIISIGATVGNIITGQVFEKLHVIIKVDEHISSYITDLTKITQEDVNNGTSLEEGYKQLKRLHEKYLSFINPITWGGGDSQELFEQLKKLNPNFDGWCFGRRWIDAKTLFVSHRLSNGQPIQGGLAKSMLKYGLKFEGQKHNARDDAYNTFRMYVKMLELLKNK